MRKPIIEARINEYMMREQGNPNVPYTPEEIARDAVACLRGGRGHPACPRPQAR